MSDYPLTFYGPIEGGQCYQIISESPMTEQEAQGMAEEESTLTGWKLVKNGVLNSQGKLVYLLLRGDGLETPDFKALLNGVKP